MHEQRLQSLDAFRGLTIAAMLVVNNPGDWGHVYAPLQHAAWDGWTPTDCIFPFFVFISGISMVLSLQRRALAGADKLQLWGQATRRGLVQHLTLGQLLDEARTSTYSRLARRYIEAFECEHLA